MPGFKRLHKTRSVTMCALLLAPMGVAVEVPSDSVDTAHYQLGDNPKTTSFTFGAGSGSYGRNIHASRVISLGYDSCTGQENTQYVDANFRFENEFHDYGGEIDIQATDAFHFGARGGYITESASYLGSTIDAAVVDTLFQSVQPDTTWTQFYVNPFFSVEKDMWGIGLGVVMSNNRLWTETEEYGEHNDESVYPTGHFRVGDLQKVYVNATLWEGVPIYSGGGLWTLGVGMRPVHWFHLWGGVAAGGPYTQESFMARANIDLGRHFTLGTNVRFRKDASSELGLDPPSEFGASASLTYKILRD
ncbi:MAG TPA: hypothetical protein VFU38_10600 [Candidatus Krumholzibacteria bacterium]|nr:hypothetical protein [Candidatus Krumholzibacteria bacterium]